MRYSIPIKSYVGTPTEREQYAKLIREYDHTNKAIGRPDWNFSEWLVHKRYTERGWKYCLNWEQDEFMNKDQFPSFAEFQTLTFGAGKPDLFFYKLGKHSLKNIFVEVKTGYDVLSPEQKYFLREFVLKRKLFDFELAYVTQNSVEFSDLECHRPPSKQKLISSAIEWIKSATPPDGYCRHQWAKQKNKRADKIDEILTIQFDRKMKKYENKIAQMSKAKRIEFFHKNFNTLKNRVVGGNFGET